VFEVVLDRLPGVVEHFKEDGVTPQDATLDLRETSNVTVLIDKQEEDECKLLHWWEPSDGGTF
jgi:hypothetical protein